MWKTYIEDSELDNVLGSIENPVIDKRVLRLIFKKQLKQRSDEWLAARKSILSASDAAAALGINPHKSRADLIKQKAGFFSTGEPDPQMIRATQHGIKYEDEAAAIYGARNPEMCPLFELGLIMHEKHAFLGASPDRISRDGVLIEIKVTYISLFLYAFYRCICFLC